MLQAPNGKVVLICKKLERQITQDEFNSMMKRGVRDFSKALMRGLDMRGRDFSGNYTFERSVIIGSNLERTKFNNGTNIRMAIFGRGVQLKGAEFIRTDGYRSTFAMVNAQGINAYAGDFQNSRWHGAKIPGANVDGANFSNARLIDVWGLITLSNLDKAIFEATEVDKNTKKTIETALGKNGMAGRDIGDMFKVFETAVRK